MKHAGVRAHSTAHTMNIQGMLDELEADWHEEVEKVVARKTKEEKEKEEKERKRGADYDLAKSIEDMAKDKILTNVRNFQATGDPVSEKARTALLLPQKALTPGAMAH